MNKRIKDPFKAREAANYENPVPSREYILSYLEDIGKPLGFKKLAKALNLTDDDQIEAIRRRLIAMVRDGQLIRDRRGAFCLLDKMSLIKGRVIAHPDGFGFVHPETGDDDYYLAPRQMNMLLHGDEVLIHEIGIDRRGRKEGAVVEVLERRIKTIVGRYHREGNVAFVTPDNPRINRSIVITKPDETPVNEGQIVLAEIVKYPRGRDQMIGRIIEILGAHMGAGVEIDVAMHSYQIPSVWPQALLDEIKQYGKHVPTQDLEGRKDLREIPFVTIDGKDAKDFDDAVYCEPGKRGGWRLLVAIADVSHYVKPGSALDQEAIKRGNSVYFPGRVVPMLPKVLSNGLCSLNPEVNRLCMVCDMQINAKGQIRRSTFYQAVMVSHARMIYDDVAQLLETDDKVLRQRYHALLPHLFELRSLFDVLHRTRQARGAMDFDTTETRIVFDDDQKIKKIVPVERNIAHRIIEECMLAANICAAKFLVKNKIPGLFRVHAGPPEDKLKSLREFLGELSLSLKGGKTPTPKNYAALIASIADRPDKHLIETVLLRSLSQAVYHPDNIGHFGLAYDTYAHFTSPIRRYPDLLLHRAINHILQHQPIAAFEYTAQDMLSIAEQCSVTERRADEATRDVVNWLKCEYMSSHLGTEFKAVISAVTSFGVFVELDQIYIEGLVHITNLKSDYYHFDSVKHRLIGERTRTTYQLGDSLRVKVAGVNIDDRKIDLVLV